MKSALFLIDSGAGIGLGHLRRSGILLDAMVASGFECRILCPDIKAAAALGRMAAPMPATIKDVPFTDIIVCDSYSIQGEQLSSIRHRCTVLLVFDDMGDREFEADLVLNHNLYGAEIDYSHLTRAVMLSGPECTLVDPEILNARTRRTSGAGIGIVVSFGGTDDGTRAIELATHLPPDAEGPRHIVVPPGIVPSARAAALASAQPDRFQLRHGADMPALLAEARLYIGGAGMTALEAMVVGLDMVLFVLAENQRLNAQAFARFGHPVVQGFEPVRGANIAAQLLHRPYRQHASPVDGNGAARVVGAIERLLQAKGRA